MGYTNAKPNFCRKSGKPLSSFTAKGPVGARQRSISEEQDEYDEEENDDHNFGFENMSKLEIEIQSVQVQRHTLGNIIESQPEGQPPQNFSNQFENLNTEPKQTNEEFLKEFQSEAGTSRPNG